MKLETAHSRILRYLQSHGPTNTYRLSAILKIDRLKLIIIIEELAKEGLTEFSSNIARIARARKEQKGRDKPETHSAPKLSDASPGKEFHFCNGIHVKNLDELLTALKTIDDGVYQYHANNEKNDFSNWISEVIGKPELASNLKTANKHEAINILNNFLVSIFETK